jgi:uncharacterized protein DUF6983
MTTFFQIPIPAPPLVETVTLSGTVYTLTLQYRNTLEGGWILDIGDSNNNPIVTGIPLVTGSNLLAQYAYLGFIGGLFVQTTSDPDAVPTFDNLGTDGLLWYVTEP